MPVVFSVDFLRRPRSTQSSHIASQKNGLFLPGENGGTVILVHGLTGTPNEMRFVAHFLNQEGYSVICPRLANHGEPVEVLQHTTWQDCYHSVRDALLKINTASHTGPIFAAGLSMGALLALLLADEFPDQIAGVSCLSPTLFYDGWNIPWYRPVAIPLLCLTPLRRFCYFKEEPPYGIKNEAVRRRVHQYYRQASLHKMNGVADYGYPYIPASLFHQLHLLVKHLRRRLPSIRVPVQLIQAEHDDITSIKNSSLIYSTITSAVKELVLLHNSYHVITADQEREVVAQKMQGFFSRIRNGARSPDLSYGLQGS